MYNLSGVVSVLHRLAWFDRLPYPALLLGAVLLGLAPFSPEPHLVEKLRMLSHGELVRPIDIFDLFLHGTPTLMLLLKLLREGLKRRGADTTR
jgi:hypothetical protein